MRFKDFMNKKYWILLYFAVLAVDLFAVYSGNETIRYASKTLLMPLLVVYFVLKTKSFIHSLKKWMILALVFSWTGDIFLLFEYSNSNYFIFGLIAFLVAHVFYIVLFDKIRIQEQFKQSLLPLLPIAVYYILLITLLQPKLGAMQKPVSIYGLVISIMLSFAADLWRLKDRRTAFLIISGAILFITSDSLLAINKFHKQFEYAGLAVMFTYGIAQLLITLGAARHISSSSTHKFAS